MSNSTTSARGEQAVAAAASAPDAATSAHDRELTATSQASGVASPSRFPRSEKISDEHLQRRAIVYVRQSTQQQVLEHRATRSGCPRLDNMPWRIGRSRWAGRGRPWK